MASQMCWGCFSRFRISLQSSFTTPPSLGPSRSFSTTAPKAVNPQAAKKPSPKPRGPPVRGERRFKLTKNARVQTSRVPAPGERKAIRKRIVLSNTNAFEVRGLQDWDRENWVGQELAGEMVGLPGPVVDSLRAIEAFKPNQSWGFFRRPATLVRNETMELARHMENLEQSSGRTTLRSMIVGEKGCGKSVLLLQAQAMAFLKGWVVIHIPEAQDLVIAHTAYEPLPDTSPTRYVQKTYMANLLSQIGKANNNVLSKLQVLQEHNLPIPAQGNFSLSALASLGVRDPEIAWPVFQALWTELTIPSSSSYLRPPILVSLDGLAHISRFSEYLAPSMHFIHAHDLAVVHHFLSYLSGTRDMPNGGLVLAADSNSNRPSSPALDLAIRQNEARQVVVEPDAADPRMYDPENPYMPIDDRTLLALRGVDVMRLKGFTKEEVRAVLEYYAKSGMLRQTVTERLISERWTVAGGGVVGELERATLKMAI